MIWRGGTSEQRLQADLTLKKCVLQSSHDPALAELMFTGVREGGGPQFATPFRWGYGWSHRRQYRELSADELSHAADLARDEPADAANTVCKMPVGAMLNPRQP